MKRCCVGKKADEELKQAADFLKIIAEENRLKILCFLFKNNEQCVCKIWQYLELPQNLVSHHLKVLRDFDLLNTRKERLNIFYSINHKKMLACKKIINCFLTKGDRDN